MSKQVLELATSGLEAAPGTRPVDAARAQVMLASVGRVGQKSPGVVGAARAGGGRLVYDGNTRLHCCRELGLPFRAVEADGEPTPEEVAVLRLTLNHIRVHRTADELRDDLEAVRRAGNYRTLDALAGATGMSKSYLSKILNVRHIDPGLRSVTDALPTTAQLLLAAQPVSVQREVVQAITGREVTREMIEGLIAAHKPTGPKAKPRFITVRVPVPEASPADAVAEALKQAAARAARFKDVSAAQLVALFK